MIKYKTTCVPVRLYELYGEDLTDKQLLSHPKFRGLNNKYKECFLCGKEDFKHFMVHNDLWNPITEKYGFTAYKTDRWSDFTEVLFFMDLYLCYQCCEKELGRSIKQTDLKDVPINFNNGWKRKY